jgi:uncharacterized membrane protein
MSSARPNRGSGRDLGTPRRTSRLKAPRYNRESFGNLTEDIARFLGTARYLAFQTVVVTGWIGWNAIFHGSPTGFDPYPFILLTLALSLQASYAAPLILLAQARQEERDRAALESDRRANARAQASTEYLARELAAIRLSVGEMPTRDYLDDQLDRLSKEIENLRASLGPEGRPPRDQGQS